MWQLSFPATQNDPQQEHLHVRASVPTDGIVDEMRIAPASPKTIAADGDEASEVGSEPWLEV